MKIIKPSYEILTDINGADILKRIEAIGRTCYKSESNLCQDCNQLSIHNVKGSQFFGKKWCSEYNTTDIPVAECLQRKTETFIRSLLKSNHLSVLEYIPISVRFICDRGVTHELVRHRLASYSITSTIYEQATVFIQESSRYCNYSKDKFDNELTFIKPCFWEENTEKYLIWHDICQKIEEDYMILIKTEGVTSQEARSILPNSLKTEIVMTCNLRELRHVFALRCSKAAHPQMREIMIPLLKEFKEKIPVIFDNICLKHGI